MVNLGIFRTLRLKAGAFVYDLPNFIAHLWPSTNAQWIFLCNRDEELLVDHQRRGAQPSWQWTSDLHIARAFPRAGRALLKRAFRDWPIRFQTEPPAPQENCDVSFVIGHRGLARVPHLLATLQTIAGQAEVSFECIVIEQSNQPEVKALLPPWVQYVHTPLPSPEMPYSRSWAFNVGAEIARGRILILHDNDMLLPMWYAAEVYARCREGYEVVNLKRFIFYLSQQHSKLITNAGSLVLTHAPESVVQNLEAGGSFGITREAYFAIGGFDETFVGWGGEDNEFWERAQTRNVWSYGYMPLVHLWHEAQPEKKLVEQAPAKRRYWSLAQIPPEARIQALLNPIAKNRG